ncbi:MAG: Deoxyuridine 5'-triphosphate nucleotidohydrolase [Parcubacteria group bacterium GW2011_GWA2_36_10]|nr:MAG: Deoxyuridine 5'-triphosphate nucleotidohydrolase [Parcubacteria group bacterium GW2011_GWA2_36_10]
MKIKVKKLKAEAVLPQMMRQGDAAFDLATCEDVLLHPGETKIIPIGLALEIPVGFVGNIRDRSGLAGKHALHTLAGIIDSNYRGEIGIVMTNLSQTDYQIKIGDRVAQMLIQKIEITEFEEVEELSDTNRGEKGFNSSGY